MARDIGNSGCYQIICTIITGAMSGLYLVTLLQTPKICDHGNLYYNIVAVSIINIIIHPITFIYTICIKMYNNIVQIISIILYASVIGYNIFAIKLFHDNYDSILLRYDSCEDKYPGQTPYSVKFIFKLSVVSVIYFGLLLISLVMMVVNSYCKRNKVSNVTKKIEMNSSCII